MATWGGRASRGVAIAVTLLVAAPGASMAATLTVNTTADEVTPGDGTCSLREAISAVNAPGTSTDCGIASAGANTIKLGPNSYALTRISGLIFGPPPTGCLGGGNQHTDDNSRGDLTIFPTVQDLTIAGAGTALTTIDACKLDDRALNVQAGASVTLSDLTVANGHAPAGHDGAAGMNNGQNGSPGDPGENGGGILNAGTLTLTGVTVTASDAGRGGLGGAGQSATSTAVGGSGAAGGSGGEGGGIYNAPTGHLTLVGSTVSGDLAGTAGPGGAAATSPAGNGGAGGSGGSGGSGGGIESLGELTLIASTVNGDEAGAGGDGAAGADSVTNGGNGGSGGAGGAGGGVSADGGSWTATNSTITGNTSGTGGQSAVGGNNGGGDILVNGAGGNGGNAGDGGGLNLTNLTSSSLLNVTLAANGVGSAQAGSLGGDDNANGNNGAAGTAGIGAGLFVSGATPTTLQNTIVSSNRPGGNCSTTTAVPIANAITDAGHNLAFEPPSLQGLHPPGACPSTFLPGDPMLGPLQNNLGPTATMALGAGSAAIDKVPSTGAGCPVTDERGLARPSGPACDIGAYEVTPPAVTVAPATGVTTTSATIHGTVVANAISATADFKFGTSASGGAQTADLTAGGTVKTAVSAKLTGLKPHTTYHYKLIATSPDGASTSTGATFTTQALKPVISALKVKPGKFVASRKGGAKISYKDSTASRTTFVVFRVKRGKHGKKRFVRVGSFARNDRAGKDSFHFNGRIGKRKLATGTYRITATPRAFGLTGKGVSASFRVKPKN